jgi:hypothetical protein
MNGLNYFLEQNIPPSLTKFDEIMLDFPGIEI